jgi:acyl-CoA dehydrogenase
LETGDEKMILNPRENKYEYLDEKSRSIMLKTIEFFENKGKARLKSDYHEKVWYADFIEFLKKEKVFATLLTPSAHGGEGCRWDTYRNCAFNEILGFYGLPYWYTWQVTILGLGPIWMGANEAVKAKTARLLEEGGIFAFGLSEKGHGADLYSSEMALTPLGEGRYVADGGKYYIGNANEAALVSTFGKDTETDEYVFFVVNFQARQF